MSGTKRRKAQSSTEFIIIFSITMAVFLAVLAVVGTRDAEYLNSQRAMQARFYADSLSGHINQVFLAGPGSVATLSVPSVLDDNTQLNLSVSPEGRFTVAAFEGGRYISPFITTLRSPNTTMPAGYITIRFKEDGVYIG